MPERREHLDFGAPDPRPFRSPQGGGGDSKPLPTRDRTAHTEALTKQIDQLAAIWAKSDERLSGSRGHLAAVDAAPGSELPLDSLGDKRTDVAVVGGDEVRALIHVRHDDLKALRKKIAAYGSKDTKKGRPSNEPLVAPLDLIGDAQYTDLVSGELANQVIDPGSHYWLELWTAGGRLTDMATRSRVGAVVKELAALSDPENADPVTFVGTERDIHLVRLSGKVLADLPNLAPDVYRVERPSDARADRLARDYAGDLVADAIVSPPSPTSTAVTLLDTGVAEAHPLLAPLLVAPGVSVVPGETSPIDGHGHGTELAGVAAFGETLSVSLLGGIPVVARARLENIRCRSTDGNTALWAARTELAVEAAETMGGHHRVFNLALSDDQNTAGERTSWSTALDRLAFNDGNGRLFCVAIGNAPQFTNPDDYPTHNLASFAHDPAQAPNVLTVGAITTKTLLSTPGSLTPIAAEDQTSPYTSSNISPTSSIKPEIVLEGGNACPDGTLMNLGEADLSTLTTGHEPAEGKLLAWTYATSAACAEASGLSAEIWDANPTRRPETIRALLVNSARWPAALMKQHPDKKDRLRIAGYGIPQPELALASALTRPTLIHEGALAPDQAAGDARRGMQLLRLPLPDAELLALGDAQVELAATLSYFGEPNEARRALYFGATLAWDLQRRGETPDRFMKRVSDDWRPLPGARALREQRPTPTDDWHWDIGIQARKRGTVQADRLRTDAASLAGDKLIAIWPTMGWWADHKERVGDTAVNYSFVLTVDAGDAEIDLYALIKARLSVRIPVPLTAN